MDTVTIKDANGKTIHKLAIPTDLDVADLTLTIFCPSGSPEFVTEPEFTVDVQWNLRSHAIRVDSALPADVRFDGTDLR